MQKNIFKALGIFTLALLVLSMTGAASACSSHGHNQMFGHNQIYGHNHRWNSLSDNGQSGNDVSCKCGNDSSCKCGNDGSCKCGNDNGQSDNDGSSNSLNDNGQNGNDGSTNSQSGNDGSTNGQSGNDGSTNGQSGNDGSTVSTPSASFVTVHPHEGNTYWVGADGHQISLINNNNAVNPTYSQLLSFIKEDKTDEQRYIPGEYTCGDFAETVHNNAEKAGYKAGWVTVEGINHCCNAFQTSDEGMVYIDCTGSPNGEISCDTSVKLENGIEYQPIPLFIKNYYINPMGIISSYKAYW